MTNHHLANVFEVRVGKGKLLFSSIDLIRRLEERPSARQLRSSLLQYMESPAFNPSGLVQMDDLDFLDKESIKQFEVSDIYND